jgi:GMP synthase (glutamine-hydrolysing)
MSMKAILIVKTGGTYTDMAVRCGDFEDWFIARMDRSAGPIETISPYLGAPLPAVSSFGGIIITGSHDMVTDKHDWSEKTADWIKQAVESEIPVLGVCYGHQLLAHAMGGVVGDNPKGKRDSVRYQSGSTNRGGRTGCLMAPRRHLSVQACHSQSVLRLPAGATLLASSDMDPHHAFSIGRRAWGVQFHPEFDGLVVRLYIQRFAEELGRQGIDVDRLLAEIGKHRKAKHCCAGFKNCAPEPPDGVSGNQSGLYFVCILL